MNKESIFSASPEEWKNRFKVAGIIGALVLVNNLVSRDSSPDVLEIVIERDTRNEFVIESSENSIEGDFENQESAYPQHTDIVATVFWVGENEPGLDNRMSAWDEKWVDTFGGVDDPYNRCGYWPCDFIPQENPFYFALPVGDKAFRAASVSEKWGWDDNNETSPIKNRWIKITKGDQVAYGQWEDVGPWQTDDVGYVFGESAPRADRAGLDVSPAIATYLEFEGKGIVSWEFVDETDVPEGPWTQIVTVSK